MSLWKPHGLCLSPKEIKSNWFATHVQVPVVDIHTGGDFWRIYFSGRNNKGQSRITFVDTERGNPQNILKICEHPICDFGQPGSFDDSGYMPTHIINTGERKFLYYIGWTQKVTVAYQNAVGIIEVKNDSYQKLFKGPILGMDKVDPFFVGTFMCIQEENYLKGYYLSTNEWSKNPYTDKLEPIYDIKTATSLDGIEWTKSGITAIPLKENEGGLASAAVIKLDDQYLMWYSKRGKYLYRNKDSKESYDLGFAISNNGDNWTRLDDFHGLPNKRQEWESDMRGYPYIIQENETLYLFYNGNGFGQTGFGYATCTIQELKNHIKDIELPSNV